MNKYPGYYALKTLHVIIRSFHLTYKKITQINVERNSDKLKINRKFISSCLLNCLVSRSRIIFLDETGLKFNISPRYGFAIKGEKPYIKSDPESENFSVLMAFDRFGVISFMIFKESIKSEDYLAFLYQLVNNDLYDQFNKKVVFFMDNASIHKSKLFQESFAEDYNVLYNTPYSPHLNAIEQVFSFIKRQVRKIQPKSGKQLADAILLSTPIMSGNFIHSIPL